MIPPSQSEYKLKYSKSIKFDHNDELASRENT